MHTEEQTAIIWILVFAQSLPSVIIVLLDYLSYGQNPKKAAMPHSSSNSRSCNTRIRHWAQRGWRHFMPSYTRRLTRSASGRSRLRWTSNTRSGLLPSLGDLMAMGILRGISWFFLKICIIHLIKNLLVTCKTCKNIKERKGKGWGRFVKTWVLDMCTKLDAWLFNCDVILKLINFIWNQHWGLFLSGKKAGWS